MTYNFGTLQMESTEYIDNRMFRRVTESVVDSYMVCWYGYPFEVDTRELTHHLPTHFVVRYRHRQKADVAK